MTSNQFMEGKKDQWDMVRSLPKKSLLVGGGDRPLVLSPGPNPWFLVLGPSEPDLGPGPELDNKTPYFSIATLPSVL